MRIDAHAHLIEYFLTYNGKGEGRAIGNGTVQFADGDLLKIVPDGWGEKGFSAESYIKHIMDPYRIDKAVLIQSGLYGLQNLYYAELMEKYPGRFVGACGVDPYAVNKEKIIDHMVDDYHFALVKFETSEKYGLTGIHPDMKLDGKEFQEIYAIAGEKDVAVLFDIGSYPEPSYQVKELSDMIKAFPGTRFVIAHFLGMNRPMDQRWEDDMEAVTADNVWFDISSLPFFMQEKYPYDNCLKMVEYMNKKVGSSRMMWGSDAPFICVSNGFEDIYQYLEASKELTAYDLDYIYGRTAEMVYFKN